MESIYSKETVNLLEEVIQNNLGELANDQVEDEEDRKKKTLETCELLDRMTEISKSQMEYEDKEKRREVDRIRNDQQNEIEKKKLELEERRLEVEASIGAFSWQRFAFEIGKIMLPTISKIRSFEKCQKRAIKFEETGRFSSQSARDIKLNDILKF